MLVHTGVSGKLREVQDAHRAKGRKAPSFVIKLREIAACVGTARKLKAALEQGSAQMISDLGKMRTSKSVGQSEAGREDGQSEGEGAEGAEGAPEECIPVEGGDYP